ncbi:MAG: DNA topoisomerase [Candidatus Heimdallarchaeota archaeon]
MSTIIISEKNKAAEAIAEALGPVKVLKRGKKLNIYYVSSRDLYVIPLRGHILEYRNTEDFKSWTKSNPREIITNDNAIKKFPITGTRPFIQALKEFSKLADHCIIGTDADIEGCNIGIFDALPYIKQANPKIEISQLWLSSLQKSEILNKFRSLTEPKYSWAESGEARAIIDAIIGFSATREVTNTFKSLLIKLKIKFTSIGRVQTSLLYLIYLREKEIITFVPEPFFTIDAVLIHDKGTFKAEHERNPFSREKESEVNNIFLKIKDEIIAQILDYSKNLVKRSPPTPLTTSKALILLTKNLKIPANVALNTMNALYLNKLISYPRTDSDVYKPDFEHEVILTKFSKHSSYGTYTEILLKAKKLVPTKGKKDAGDHPPITPIASVELDDPIFQNNLQKKVYDLLSRHYLALFGEDATESKQKLKLLIKDEPFKAQIVSLIFQGFLEIAPFLRPHYDTAIQIHGEKIPVKEITLNKKETKPPPRYRDNTLLKLMEKHHLGTKSTRPIIIRILQKRNLLKRSKVQYFLTELGTFLIENLIKIWLPFLKPDFTKSVEIRLDSIKENTRKMQDVIKEVKKEFLELFDKFLLNKPNFLKKIKKYEAKAHHLNSSTRDEFLSTTSLCPFCKLYTMKFIYLKEKRFLACSNDKCKKYLPLPKKGKIEMLNSTCSLCGFNIFKISLRKHNSVYTYYLCPDCWREGLKNRNGKGFCSNCDSFKISRNQCIKK